MKRILCVLLCLLVLLSGCGKKEKAKKQGSIPAQLFYDPLVPVAPTEEPEDPEAILAQRRDVVEAHMRYMGTVRWQVDQEVTYSYRGIVAGNATKGDTITLKPGRIYQGIPYTHGTGSAYNFLDYAVSRDEDGVYMLSGLSQAALDGTNRTGEGACARVGNDCADCVFWAWSQVSSSISFENTIHMTETYGCLKVGDYQFDLPIMQSHTSQVTADNGEETMFAAYAQLQKGDALVYVKDSAGGHAIMAVSVHVDYQRSGKIDGKKSYITFLEQNAGSEVRQQTMEEDGKVIYLCEVLDKKISFQQLYNIGYLPITCQELIDPAPLAEATVRETATSFDQDNLFCSVVTSNYRITSVTVTICDGEKVLQKATCHGVEKEGYHFQLLRFTSKAEKPVMIGDIDLTKLPPGTYRCTFDCRLSNGQVVRFRDFDMTI